MPFRVAILGTVLLSVLSTNAIAQLGASSDGEIDAQTGLKRGPGFEQAKAHCTVCHSGRLVAQNRASREGWLALIRWMQGTQGLWNLGSAEESILDYLAATYGPVPRGRRAPLNVTFESADDGTDNG